MEKTNKLKPTVIRFSEPVFRTAVTGYINCTWKEARAQILKAREPLKHLPDEDFGDGQMGLAMYLIGENTGAAYQVLWIAKFTWTIEDMACLAHELQHLTHQALGFKEIPLNKDTDEVYAYLYECYFSQVFNKLKPIKKV